MENNQSSGISAIPVTSEPLQKIQPGPSETIDSLTTKAKWVLIVLLTVFPPYAWYLMAKYRSYHGWMANVILFNGLLPLIVTCVIVLFYLPTLLSLQESLGMESSSWYGSLIFGSIISIFFIGLGIYFKRRVKKQGGLSKRQLVIAIITLAMSYILTLVSALYSIMSVIYPIYAAVSASNVN